MAKERSALAQRVDFDIRRRRAQPAASQDRLSKSTSVRSFLLSAVTVRSTRRSR